MIEQNAILIFNMINIYSKHQKYIVTYYILHPNNMEMYFKYYISMQEEYHLIAK